MNRRIPILAGLLLGAVACAGVLQTTAGDAVTPTPAPRTPRRSPPAAEAPKPAARGTDQALAARCDHTCRHILAVSAGEGEAPEAGDDAGRWLAACVDACTRDATVGQVECYERVTRPGELEACTVR